MKFTFVYFVQCNMTYGAGKRVDRPCFIDAFSVFQFVSHRAGYLSRFYRGDKFKLLGT